jgi:hypothetical protein
MKSILFLIVTLSIGFLTAQENANVVSNTAQSMLRAANSGQSSFSGAAFFVNPFREIKGSIYLFDTWDNHAVIYLDDKQRLILNNININIERNSFDSRISQDSIFTFNTNNIVKFIINNKTYKNLYSEEGKRIYEIVYESKDNFLILKGFSIKLIQGSSNPMVNRKDDKYSRGENYFLKQGMNTIKPFKLNKKKILSLISEDKDRIAKLVLYMEDNDLSYKKSNDIKRGLDFSALN